MKKSLFLLPLLAGLALCSCGGGDDPSDDPEEPGEFAGLTLDYAAFEEIAEESGYQTGDIEIEGFAVSYTDIIAKEYVDAKYSSGDTEKSSELFPVIQWKKSSAEIIVSDVNPTKMTLTYITTYDPTNIASVDFGGKSISGKKSGTPEVVGTLEKVSGGKSSTYDIKRCTYVYNINATELGELTIGNKTSYAQYVESIVLE